LAGEQKLVEQKMQDAFVGLTYARFHVAPGRVSLPDTCCDLIFDNGVLLVAGPSSRAKPVPATLSEVHLVQIDPFSAHAGLGISIQEITDRIMPLVDIAPALARPLTEIFGAGEAASLISASSKRRRPGRLRYAAEFLASGGGVRQAAEAVNLSVRQFERRFVQATGLSPRAYRRISRFRLAMQAAAAGEKLSAAAQAAGFADQSHFNRDTRHFAGQNPTELVRHVANVQDTKVTLR
jgi:AraC-like DNA-binding protein